MIQASKLKEYLDKYPKYAGTIFMTIYDVLSQGFSEYIVEDEYDFHRLHEEFTDLGYNIEADCNKLKMRVTL